MAVNKLSFLGEIRVFRAVIEQLKNAYILCNKENCKFLRGYFRLTEGFAQRYPQ